MCGRFTQKSERKVISLEFYVKEFGSEVFTSYNVAPGQDAGVILGGDVIRYDRYRWGLVPFWAKDTKIGYRMINARSETVTEKPSFRNAFKARRCLVPADGFYEWRKDGQYKTPFYIHLASNRPMSFAGLWETWQSKESKNAASDTERAEPLHTFTIITTEANEKLLPLHDRMPVIVPPEKRSVWLKEDTHPDQLKQLLEPYPSEEMAFHEVSKMVNTPKNNRPECIEPVKGAS
jgi:putative SOS response-associated peptidase YedK